MHVLFPLDTNWWEYEMRKLNDIFSVGLLPIWVRALHPMHYFSKMVNLIYLLYFWNNSQSVNMRNLNNIYSVNKRMIVIQSGSTGGYSIIFQIFLNNFPNISQFFLKYFSKYEYEETEWYLFSGLVADMIWVKGSLGGMSMIFQIFLNIFSNISQKMNMRKLNNIYSVGWLPIWFGSKALLGVGQWFSKYF